MSQFDRRRFLYATGGFAGLLATRPFDALAEQTLPSFPSNPFTLAVASGDPLSNGFVLWTRLAVEPLAADGHGGMDPVRTPVQWIVATDDAMRNVVTRSSDRVRAGTSSARRSSWPSAISRLAR
jgi:alkaline phosphatase D